MNQPENPGSEVFPLTSNARPADKPLKVTTAPRSKPPRTAWTYTKWALAGSFCLGAALAGTFAGNLYWKTPIIRQFVSDWVKHPSFTDPLVAYQPTEKFPVEQQHEITLLLMGVDHDYDERRPTVSLATRGRSDAILLAKVNFDTGIIKAMSIPRDSLVHIPDHGYSKINAAYAMGGAELAKSTIKEVFGISVDYYAAFNFEGFRKIVDALGGIDVDIKRQMDYDDNWGNLHIHLKPGFRHLTGYQAMGYVRYRHGDNDLMRAERQQQFLEALRTKIKSPQTLLNLADVLGALTDSIASDLTTDQMITLGNFAKGLKRENIEVGTLPVIEGPSYVYIKQHESEDLIRRLFFPDGLTSVSVNVPPRSVVVVKNDRGDRKRGGKKQRGRHGEGTVIEATDTTEEVSVTPDAVNEETPAVENTDTPPKTSPDSGSKSDTPKTKENDPKPSGGEGGSTGGGGGTETPSGGGEKPAPSGDGAA